jgi:hypothetical protein
MGTSQELVVVPSNVYLIEINILIAYLPLDMYTQYASKGPSERFFIHKGSAGVKSIGSKSVTVLAQNILYFPSNHYETK